jgi:hypothetical protein
MADVTLADVNLKVVLLEQRVNDGFQNLSAQLDSQRYVTLDRYKPETDEQNRRIERIEDGNKWLSRLIIGTVVGLVINGLLLVLVARGGP